MDSKTTPRTDLNEAAWSREYEKSRECGWPSINYVVDADFARELERENAKLSEAMRFIRDNIAKHGGFSQCLAKLEAAGFPSLANAETCERCVGQGWYPWYDSRENEIQTQCESCNGRGVVFANDAYRPRGDKTHE